MQGQFGADWQPCFSPPAPVAVATLYLTSTSVSERCLMNDAPAPEFLGNLNANYKLAIFDLDSVVSDFEAIVKLSDGFNGADLRNVCTEAGEALNILVLGPLWQSMFLIFFQCSRRFICHSLRPGVCHPGRLHESSAQGGRFKEAGVQAGLQTCINALLPRIYIVVSPGVFSLSVDKT